MLLSQGILKMKKNMKKSSNRMQWVNLKYNNALLQSLKTNYIFIVNITKVLGENIT